MSERVSITKSKLDNLANAVSAKSGEEIPLTIDEMAAAVMRINTSGTITLQDKSVTPTESAQQVTADAGYDGLGEVDVAAVSSSYVGTSIPRRTSEDMAVSGKTVTAPSGYYQAAQSKSVETMALPTETGQIAGTYVATIEQSTAGNEYLCIPTGYNETASHYLLPMLDTQILPSGADNFIESGYTQQGTIGRSSSNRYLNIPHGYNASDSYYTISGVPDGAVTAPSTISDTGASISTENNTLTLSKTVSVTPNVTIAGYISAGTAGSSTVSLTASTDVRAAQTIHPSTTDQTIGAHTYLNGAQTIKAVTTSNLTADNIKSGVIVKIGDSTDDDCVTSVTGTYSGSGSSKNVQVAQSTSRATSSTYTSVVSLTCSTAGTYDVYWDCFRSSTGGTNGSQLYLGSTAYGTANTSFTNHAQTNHLTGVSISKNQTVAVYARSRGSNYYAYVGTLTIIQTA